MRQEFRRCQDTDAWLRTYETGANIGFLPQVLAIKHAHRQIPGAISYWYKLQLIQAALSRAVSGTRHAGDLALLQAAYSRHLRSFAGWARRNGQLGLSLSLYLSSLSTWVSSHVNQRVARIIHTKTF